MAEAKKGNSVLEPPAPVLTDQDGNHTVVTNLLSSAETTTSTAKH